MGRCYEQFSLEERCTLSRLGQTGKAIRQIAAAMDRAPSTIARELKRNSGTQVGYQPAYAEQQAKSRRWRGSRLLRKPELQQEVLKALGQGWSPAQVCGRLKKENRRQVISYETIYRFIDAQRSGAPTILAGDTTCLGEKVSEGGVDIKAVVRSIISRTESPSIGVRPTSTSGDNRVIGRRT
jgi:IS30 family transposase